ncbi:MULTISPECIES: hypothetical protein [Corynebacterium]|uniref:Uncharacterized protein n=1 Tax=Corynebacterium hadale TaxID=2026255 RepID=A0A269PG17_9CORY|nr:hypothetical protein [Corynebacterium hadale]PAJ71227.1 hypothetical protein CIG21_00355 [Corynebacterium hadale]WKC59159.1 hypothetical protein CHAD_01210 [Corynebacterium hadale]
MSEERQLTVAELLARAQQDNPEAGKRRRRRRSLEDGGVSVAELTGSLKKVEARPPESKHSNVPIDAPPQPPKDAKPTGASAPVEVVKVSPKQAETKQPAEPKAPSAGDTAVLRKVTDASAPKTEPKAAPKAEPKTEPKAAGASRPVRTEDTSQIPVVAPEPSATAPVEPREKRPVEPAAPVQSPEAVEAAEMDEPVDEGVNPIVLVLLVFVGVLLGVLGFLAFQWVWAHMSTIVAAILGVVAVLAVIFGVRAMRTGKDALTVTMAGIAAVVMAFGPTLI